MVHGLTIPQKCHGTWWSNRENASNYVAPAPGRFISSETFLLKDIPSSAFGVARAKTIGDAIGALTASWGSTIPLRTAEKTVAGCIQNLRPWPKGVSGNPAGRPK